jgi:hypothetical protein
VEETHFSYLPGDVCDLVPVSAGRGTNSSKFHESAGLCRRNRPETFLKPDCVNLRASPAVEERQKEIAMRKMIQVGSKEEVELLLALFGSHARSPKKQSR